MGRFLRDRGGSLNVAQRGAKMGDTLIIDFEVRNKETQEAIPSMDQSRHELDCIAEENFLPGVMPQMMGMSVGEQRTFDFSFPDPWEPVELAGVEASVRRSLPELLCRYTKLVCDERSSKPASVLHCQPYFILRAAPLQGELSSCAWYAVRCALCTYVGVDLCRLE